MRKLQIRCRVWLLLFLGIWCIWQLTERWDTHKNAEQFIIVDMIGENQQEDSVFPDAFEGERILSARLVVDAGGAVLILVGLGVLVTAIVSFRLRY